MIIEDFLWLPDIVEKLAHKHGLTQDEIEEVFFDQPHYRFVEKGYRAGEDVYVAFGQTFGGRYLVVYFILKANNAALIVSGRDMDRAERRLYERVK